MSLDIPRCVLVGRVLSYAQAGKLILVVLYETSLLLMHQLRIA